jgi:hypothetical protein
MSKATVMLFMRVVKSLMLPKKAAKAAVIAPATMPNTTLIQ